MLSVIHGALVWVKRSCHALIKYVHHDSVKCCIRSFKRSNELTQGLQWNL